MDVMKSMLGGGKSEGGSEDGTHPEGSDKMPSREEMVKTIESLQKAQKAQSTANDLKSRAMALTDSKQREKMLKEAFDKEVEAHGHSKMARRLQSGTWQGFGFGGGIGAATGLGIGAGVGTVLGAIAAVPTTGLGLLIGSGVGAIHGPWVKLGGKEEKFEDADPEKVAEALEQEVSQQKRSEVEQAAIATASETERSGEKDNAEEKPRRKPPKLEIRSKQSTESDQQPKTDVNQSKNIKEESKPRRKPKKLEIRSTKSSTTTVS
ncbi:uncharacterized protein Z520_04703 [Fonsecaea multimorphosa CBS 102226]|uniref:Uncharacterized protein n=1 Tax=Fonsecaea multimorphosa CBS 102226 TaxID=1442371 RepID=A0A0D2K003_9EURO|nr:uncharacterized protein Z520_04703 [Fonsecaea multimorphosa CBS 102226]KIX99127.1 hypothetical protein Z520_04703 [Fonsecaea multimorphosa CBS 102226]OAL26039.1 hypothetical protein AYO22_04453 [Fonsecaea multimorphosa]